MKGVHCTGHVQFTGRVKCTVYSVQCTGHVQCTVDTVHCTGNVGCTVYSVQDMYSVECVVESIAAVWHPGQYVQTHFLSPQKGGWVTRAGAIGQGRAEQ